MNKKTEDLHPNEALKENSRFLRGTLVEGLADRATGAISDDDNQLLKFHGSYQQDDRDLRNERQRQKLEPAYQFMVRVRMAGGVCTPAQWLQLDELARRYGDGGLRLTTRQTFQFHGILKRDLKAAIAGINETLLNTIATCGDINRNVMCGCNPDQSAVHAAVYDWARRLSEHLLPRTRAYHQIWLDEEQVAGTPEHEPLYGSTYLPRKFKIALAVPPGNDVDVFAHDLGFIAVVEDGVLTGFNISVGGGMGMTHSEPATFPRLAQVIGACPPEQVLEVAEQVIGIQRDFGDRRNRQHARMKYTIEDRGVDWFKGELERRLGRPLLAERPIHFEHNGDRFGWVQGADGKWHMTLFVHGGRVKDRDGYPVMTGLREIAKVHQGEFHLTPNQNVVIANIPGGQRPVIEGLLAQYMLAGTERHSPLRLNSMACVAFPTCGLAMAESERYLPSLIERLEGVMAAAGLEREAVVVRMSGCPNGCSRPYLAEIGFVGKSPGKYNLYLGGGFAGERLNKLYRESVDEEQIINELTPLIRHYAAERHAGEHFGDFVIRAGYIKATVNGPDFHEA